MTFDVAVSCVICGESAPRAQWNQVACRKARCVAQLEYRRKKRNVREMWQRRARCRRWYDSRRLLSHGARPQARPWLYGVPFFRQHLPGGGMSISLSPLPSRRIELQHGYLLHAALTGILARDHRAHYPDWSLVPWSSTEGWAVYWWRDEDAAALARTEHRVRIGSEWHQLRFGPLARIHAPKLPRRGRLRVSIESLTPVISRCSGSSIRYTAPGEQTMLSTLSTVLKPRLGLPVGDSDLCVRLLERTTEPISQYAGPKLQVERGWSGRLVVECNAVAAWLLLAAARGPGLGGRTAYGFGRISAILG